MPALHCSTVNKSTPTFTLTCSKRNGWSMAPIQSATRASPSWRAYVRRFIPDWAWSMWCVWVSLSSSLFTPVQWARTSTRRFSRSRKITRAVQRLPEGRWPLINACTKSTRQRTCSFHLRASFSTWFPVTVVRAKTTWIY